MKHFVKRYGVPSTGIQKSSGTVHCFLSRFTPSKLHTCLTFFEILLTSRYFVSGHLATPLLSVFCFANVCPSMASLRNVNIPNSPWPYSRFLSFLVKPSTD